MENQNTQHMSLHELTTAMRRHGYTSNLAADGLAKKRLADDLGKTYHCVQAWFRNENPVPKYVKAYFGLMDQLADPAIVTRRPMGSSLALA